MAGIAIICLGNRFIPGDDTGPRVFDALTQGGRPRAPSDPDVEIIDGGLCGLDLLGLLEGRRRVVFVDAMADQTGDNAITVLESRQVAALAGGYGHAAGLPYLLHMLPHACSAPPSEVLLVGAQGQLDAAGVLRLSKRAMDVALHGDD